MVFGRPILMCKKIVIFIIITLYKLILGSIGLVLVSGILLVNQRFLYWFLFSIISHNIFSEYMMARWNVSINSSQPVTFIKGWRFVILSLYYSYKLSFSLWVWWAQLERRPSHYHFVCVVRTKVINFTCSASYGSVYNWGPLAAMCLAPAAANPAIHRQWVLLIMYGRESVLSHTSVIMY